MDHIQEAQQACDRALEVFKAQGLRFRPMRRLKSINPKKSYIIGRTSLKTGLITIDIFTPVKREPKKMAGILRVLCHEVAHHQKRPYRQIFRGKLITRQHFPKFYKQVTKNIEKIKKDPLLKGYFV